jgi:anti-anti-sigma factor
MTTMGHIEVTDEAGTHILSLFGEHDMSTEPRLRAEIERLFASGSRIVVDLTDAEFIDSTVVNALVAGHERAEANPAHAIAVVAAHGTMPEGVLALVGASTVVPMFPTRAAAVGSMTVASVSR